MGFKGTGTMLTAQELKSSLPGSFLWFDYASMPQPSVEEGDEEPGERKDRALSRGLKSSSMELIESKGSSDHRHVESHAAKYLALAVASIPSYVERSAFVLVLAPAITHTDTGKTCDFKAWRSRGWCRAEFAAAALAAETKPVLVTKGPMFQPEFLMPIDSYFLLAGEGNYTCCARNHNMGAGAVPCDKLKVRSVLEAMLDTKVAHLLDKGELFRARYYVALRHWFLNGLPHPPSKEGAPPPTAGAVEAPVEALRRRLAWRDEATELANVRTMGVGLLWWAATADDLAAVHALIKAGAAVNTRVRVDIPELSVPRGATPLMLAMAFASWPVVAALLGAGADPKVRDYNIGSDALMWAAMMGRVDNMRAWLAKFPSWDLNGHRGMVVGNTTLTLATFMGKGPTTRFLLEAKADPTLRKRHASPAACI